MSKYDIYMERRNSLKITNRASKRMNFNLSTMYYYLLKKKIKSFIKVIQYSKYLQINLLDFF